MIHPPTPTEIREYRDRNGLTQRALADSLGVNIRSVQRWEAGDREPDAFLRLALERLEGPPTKAFATPSVGE